MNMCSVRQRPMPSAPKLAGGARVLGGVGVGADLQAADLVGPAQNGVDVLVGDGGRQIGLAQDHPAGGAVHGDPVAVVDDHVADGETLGDRIDLELLRPGDAGLAHAAGDDGRVGGHAAVAGDDALGVDEPVDVVGVGLPADQDDLLALGAASLRPRRRRRRPCPRRRPARRPSPVARTCRVALGSRRGCSNWSSWPGSTRIKRLFLGDEALGHHLDRHASEPPGRCACRCGSAACRASCPRW